MFNFTKKEKVLMLAITIASSNRADPKDLATVNFTVTETAKIINRSTRDVPVLFNEAGLLVNQIGKTKYYSALTIAEFMLLNPVSPIRITQERRNKNEL